MAKGEASALTPHMEAIFSKLTDDDSDVRQAAVEVLPKLDSTMVAENLLPKLEADDSSSRKVALLLLKGLGPTPPALAVEVLDAPQEAPEGLFVAFSGS